MTRLSLLTIVFCLPVLAQSHEISLTAGYNRQNSDQGNGIRANLTSMDGFAAGQFYLNNTVSIASEIGSYYVAIEGAAATLPCQVSEGKTFATIHSQHISRRDGTLPVSTNAGDEKGLVFGPTAVGAAVDGRGGLG